VYHFVALLWNNADPPARERAAHLNEKLRQSALRWEHQLCTDGLSVFAAAPSDPGLRSYELPHDAGIVLGRLFNGNLSNPHLVPGEQFDERAAEEIVRTSGEHLLRNFWGGYVALLRDAGSGRAYVIRDCSGKIPCYYTRSGNITIVFADLGDLAPLGLPAYTVNWEYLAAFIYSSQLQVRACAFNEIQEILAGECLQVRANSVQQMPLWDPRVVCRRRRIDSPGEAIAELQEVTQRCTDAWAQTCDPILLALSGGFDSAVVLGCLRNSPARPEVTCFNQFTTAPHDDERSYARLAAQRAGVILRELPMDSGADRFDARLLAGPRIPKPGVLGLFRLLEIDLINRVAAMTGARTLWTGQGGDHIFLQTGDSSSANDYFATRGLRWGFLAAVRDAARLSRQPYWFVLKSACMPDLPSRLHGTLTRQPFFVNPEALPDDTDEYVSHPWMSDAEQLPKGKRTQIRLLGEVTNRHRPIPRLELAPQHHPLMSQPLMEICLQIPTYLLVREGRERGLARQAFADRVPPQIIQRRDKGSIVSHATEMIRQSEEYLRELLLGGVLAGTGIVDRSDLELHIVHGQPLREEHFLPLLACIAAEVWARTCSTPAIAVAA
jgi:asparagine synthase (glutamine-hydrolysing)